MGADFNDNETDNGAGKENGEPASESHAPEEQAAIDASDADATDSGRLDLKDSDERLPWLESDGDDDDEADGNGGRALGFVLGGVLSLALIVGGIWWASHPSDKTEQVAAGGVIKAPAEPYKQAPKDPGGKTFAGTGDSSFAVSEGQTRPARLGQASPAAKPTPAAQPSGAQASGARASGAQAAAPVSGVGVQIAAYSNEAQAKAGWDRLSQQYEALKGVPHRIQEGQADIGTVYRLQAVAPDAAAARALCGKLKGVGLACQVKN